MRWLCKYAIHFVINCPIVFFTMSKDKRLIWFLNVLTQSEFCISLIWFVLGLKALKNRVCVLSYWLQWKVTDIFKRVPRKCWKSRLLMALKEKVLIIKKIADAVLLFKCSLKWPFQAQNSFQENSIYKNISISKQTPPANTFSDN